MKPVKVRSAAALILNFLMAVLAVISVGWFFTEKGQQSGIGNMTAGGVDCLKFFTNLSNLLAALCGCLAVPFHWKALRSGREEFPRWVLLWKLTGTTAVTVTMVVVVLFLGPIMGYRLMFEGSCFALHLICPVLAIFTFCFLERGGSISKKEALLGVLPTVLYAVVYFVNVLITKTWTDFYHFNMGGCWYISSIVMPLVTYLLALALRAMHNKAEKRIPESCGSR